MEIAVIDINGKETGRKVKLPKSIFEVQPNDHAIYLDVKHYLANQRQGTHKSKQRNEVSGSTKKLKRQKGTGGARAGSIKNPQFRGGGRIFGPQPRDYSFKLNKKVKKLARLSALTYKAKANQITVVEDLKIDQPKTKTFAGILSGITPGVKKTLLVLPQPDRNVYLASRNIRGSRVTTASDLSTYDVMNAQRLVLSESAVKELEKNIAS